MRAMHNSQPFVRSTVRRSSWWQRIAELIAALAHGLAQHQPRGRVPGGGDQVQRSARENEVSHTVSRIQSHGLKR
jgi:hypothetical protein